MLPWSSTARSVSPPPGGASGRRPVAETRWYFWPSSVDRCTNDCAVVKPHGPDSQIAPLWSAICRGSPSVRCGSTTVAGANLAFHVPYEGLGVAASGSVSDGGGGIGSGG